MTSSDKVDFRPSDVNLSGSFPPLVATFNKTEAEIAAALMVRTMAASEENAWRPVAWSEIVARVKADMETVKNAVHTKLLMPNVAVNVSPAEQLISDLARNPFCTPDIYRLVDDKFAAWAGVPGQVVEFTDKGLEQLRRWVSKSQEAE